MIFSRKKSMYKAVNIHYRSEIWNWLSPKTQPYWDFLFETLCGKRNGTRHVSGTEQVVMMTCLHLQTLSSPSDVLTTTKISSDQTKGYEEMPVAWPSCPGDTNPMPHFSLRGTRWQPLLCLMALWGKQCIFWWGCTVIPRAWEVLCWHSK